MCSENKLDQEIPNNKESSDMVQYYLFKTGVGIEALLKINFQSSNTFNVIKNILQFYQDIFITLTNGKL